MPKRATSSFAYSDESGAIIVVSPDTWYADNDPVVKLHPSLFLDVEQEIARQIKTVEQATAAPGEARNTRRP